MSRGVQKRRFHFVFPLLVFVEEELRSLSEDKRYAFVTYGDLKTIGEYRNDTVMAVRAPPETKLQVTTFSFGRLPAHENLSLLAELTGLAINVGTFFSLFLSATLTGCRHSVPIALVLNCMFPVFFYHFRAAVSAFF